MAKSDSSLVDVHGRRIGPSALQRGLRINMIAGAMGMMWMGMTLGMPIVMLMECLGASGVMIGLVATVQQLAVTMQIPAAFIVERLPARKAYWGATALAHRMLWFVPTLLPFLFPVGAQVCVWVMIGVVTVTALLAHAATATWYSWMADLVPDSARGRFWGTRQSITMAAYVAAMLLAGFLLDLYPDPRQPNGSFTGFAIVYGLGATIGCIDIIVHLWIPEPRAPRAERTASVSQRLLAPLRSPDFRWLTVSSGIWNFALGLVGSFGLIYLTREFGATYTHLSAVIISACVSTILAGRLWGRVMDHVGARTLTAILMLGSPLFTLVWFFVLDKQVSLPLGFSLPHSVLLVLIVNLPAGAFFSGVSLCQLSMCTALAPKEGRTMAMAVHWTLIGLLGALGPVAGGAIVDYVSSHPVDWVFPTGASFGFQHPLIVLFTATTWLVALPALMKVGPRTAEMPVRVFLANPLRGIGIIQNMITLGTAPTRQQRAQAVRELGARKSSFMVSDLVEKLADPSAEVREEAVQALGSIGTPEAIDALLAEFERPETDLAPQIARALRQSRDPRSVDALVRRLDDPEREMQKESARTLGEIGDPRAAPSLSELLQRSDDARVVSASSEALARLRQIAAIHEILPHLRAANNPVLKRSLTVAVGELLGKPEEFYEIFVKEEETPGLEVERLLDQFRRDLSDILAQTPGPELEHVSTLTRELEEHYHEENTQEAASLLFALAALLASLRFQVKFRGDVAAFLGGLLSRDEHFATCTLYLDMLDQPWLHDGADGRERADVLLGIFALAESVRPDAEK